MDEKCRIVLAAADAWLAAIHAIAVADEEPRRSESEQDTFDTAEVELVVAVMEWRDAGRP